MAGAGRPATLTTPTGATTYSYHATTGQLASPSGGLAYSYDGALQTAETFSGFTAGAVAWDYDASFRVTTERVNGANPITFAYDNDSLLTTAGALVYTRRATDGVLLTGTLGTTATTFTYSNFGELATEETRRGATVLYRGAYTRDDGGRISDRTSRPRLTPYGSDDCGFCWMPRASRPATDRQSMNSISPAGICAPWMH